MYHSKFDPFLNVPNFNDTTAIDEIIDNDNSDDDEDVDVSVGSNLLSNDTATVTALFSSRLHNPGDSFASSNPSPLNADVLRQQPAAAPPRRRGRPRKAKTGPISYI